MYYFIFPQLLHVIYPDFLLLPFHMYSYTNKSQCLPKRTASPSEELLKPRWQTAGHSHTTAAFWLMYSHHGELPAEILDANFFTPYFLFLQTTAGRWGWWIGHTWLSYTYETSMFYGKHEALGLPCAFRNTKEAMRLCQRAGQWNLDILKDSYFCFD